MFKRSHMYEDIPEDSFHRNPVNAFAHAWALIEESDETAEIDETKETGKSKETGKTKDTK